MIGCSYVLRRHAYERKKKGKEKLSMRYYGPFQITEQINDISFRLRLPDTWKIHNVFHVNLWKRTRRSLFLNRWETVLEYSKNISGVLGANRSCFGAMKQSKRNTRNTELHIIMQAVWDLLEIVYVDKHVLSWLAEQLINWLERYDKLFTILGPTVHSKLAVLQPRLVNTQFPEDDEDYWSGLTSALAVGWLDVVVKCLRMHGSYQHDQIDIRQTENGLVEAVVVLISKMPRLRSNPKSDTLGVTYTFKPEFSTAWERWRNQIAKLNTSSFWLECTHEGTVSGLKQLLLVLLGDANTLTAATAHWMELLVSHFLFIRPFLMGAEGLLSLAKKCVQLKPAAEDDQMVELLLAILGENTEVVLVECRKLLDPWMLTHITELLLAKNGQAQSFLTEEREVLDGMSLEEFHRLVYAQLLSSHPCTWQLAPFYLASCPRQGRGLLEAVLLMQPVSSHRKVPMKVLDICRLYDLRSVGEKYMRMVGVFYWKHGRKGLGISWLQRGRDYERLSCAANELLAAVSQTSVGDSNRLQELDGLIDLLGPQFEGFGGLAFLHRFRDFKVALYNFQEAQNNLESIDKQVIAGKAATKYLIQLMKNGITPQQFLLPLLQDSVELLEYTGEVLVTAAETNALLLKLQNFFLTNKHDDVNLIEISSQSVAKIRLALACNLGRAFLKE
ncbi:hypothetical protein L7F22_008565 [Adiantum nelumboides]|nr:hypothetical protein [Adiantum nelumboides]